MELATVTRGSSAGPSNAGLAHADVIEQERNKSASRRREASDDIKSPSAKRNAMKAECYDGFSMRAK
jgi:hypothetical protein